MGEDIRKMIDKVKNFKQFVNENMDLSKDFVITNLFRKYEEQYKPEYNEENWIKYPLW
jgi:hypothetical protein